jgi:hypothetical protein
MEGWQVNLRKITEEKLREIEALLKAAWDHIASEDVPERIKRIVDKLR